MQTALHLEVEKIRRWLTVNHQIDDYGDWWQSTIPIAQNFVNSSSFESWTANDVADLLFLINICNTEYLAETLTNKTEIALFLARSALEVGEPDARWQLASQLAFVSERHKEAESLLLRFVTDSEECVSRRALLALAALKSSTVPEFAEKAWQSGHEYQRIAALHALKAVGSPMLQNYLAAAYEDGREKLVINANRLAEA
jgi:HEAT repeat protein